MPTPKQVAKNLRRIEKGIPKAAIRSLKRVQKSVVAKSNAKIKELTKLVPKDFKDRIVIKSIKTGGPQIIAKMIYKSFSPNLARKMFKPKMVKGKRDKQGKIIKPGGLKVTIYGKRKLIERAFIGNQGRTAFIRTSRRPKPIISLKGPSSRRQFLNKNKNIMARVWGSTAEERFHIEFTHEYNRLVSAGKKNRQR